jgi:hypothetical protein
VSGARASLRLWLPFFALRQSRETTASSRPGPRRCLAFHLSLRDRDQNKLQFTHSPVKRTFAAKEVPMESSR